MQRSLPFSKASANVARLTVQKRSYARMTGLAALWVVLFALALPNFVSTMGGEPPAARLMRRLGGLTAAWQNLSNSR